MANSPWFSMAIVLTAIMFPYWSEYEGSQYTWQKIVTSSIPSLLGFSIGTISILLGFSNGPKKALHKLRGDASYYLRLVASFFHFILLQFFSLILALLLFSYPSIILSGLAFFAFSYAIFSGVAASAMIYSLAEIYDKAEQKQLEDKASAESEPLNDRKG